MTVSVIVPTFHRPDQLQETVASVLEQELPASEQLEVIVCVSDPGAAGDVQAAEALAAKDPRVRMVRAPRPGPAAARNAGILASQGWAIAFIDDDGRARAGWLKAGLRALEDADLVQGATVPAGPVPLWHHTLNVEPPSWLWETCNLIVRRQIVETVGGFDEDWNPTGRAGGHFGEDVIWGWRLVAAGASAGFAPDSIVEHRVEPRDQRGHLAYSAKLQYFPLLFRSTPEARRHFYLGYFVNRRHLMLTICAGLLAGAGVAAAAGRRPVAFTLLGAAGAAYLS